MKRKKVHTKFRFFQTRKYLVIGNESSIDISKLGADGLAMLYNIY